MQRRVLFALAACAIAAAAFVRTPASAANAWSGAFCLSYRDGGTDCGFTSLAQCQASASGTDAGCYAAPPSLVQQQGAAAAPAPARRAARTSRSERP